MGSFKTPFLSFGLLILGLLLIYPWRVDTYAQGKPALQLQTFTITLTPSPSPTSPPRQTQTTQNSVSNNPPPTTGGKSYCIDDEGGKPGNEACDDASKFDIAKGAGGVSGVCGTVIAWDQAIMDVIAQSAGRSVWDRMSSTFTSCGYSTQPYSSGYLSTFNVIDAYSLAGYREMNKTAQGDGNAMSSWWRSQAAQSAGYRWINYTPGQALIQSLTPGMAMFIGAHTGIVNSIEVDSRGNGWVSILHSNTTYWLGVFTVANWTIINTPSAVVGFGGH